MSVSSGFESFTWESRTCPLHSVSCPLLVPLALCGSFLRYYVKFPLLEGHYTTQIHSGFPWGDPRLCPWPPELAPFSWAPVLLIPWGPVASLTLQQESPNFLPQKCFLLPLMGFPITSPRNGSPHLPYSAEFPISQTRSPTPLWFHICHLPVALWGPRWAAKCGRCFLDVFFQHPSTPNAPNSQAPCQVFRRMLSFHRR